MTLINQISLLVPHYQKQRTLPLVLDRLTLQISPKDEIIIIDDHSPDGVPDCDCPRVRIIQPPKKEPHRWRLNTLRNFGIKAAKNDAILFLDPDCLPDINLVIAIKINGILPETGRNKLSLAKGTAVRSGDAMRINVIFPAEQQKMDKLFAVKTTSSRIGIKHGI